jgi:hypothetical protein
MTRRHVRAEPARVAEANSFEYDLAFSFVSVDEGIAHQINDLLSDRLRTFIYSERQEHLAGRDGEVKFNDIFMNQAMVVVVLYREEWGTTPFTRIEQTAIRNRAYNEGYDFSLFIPTSPTATRPPWLPLPRLWFSLERFKAEGAAAVIERLVVERGGVPKVETLDQRIQRQIAKKQRTDELLAFQDSTAGVQLVEREYRRFMQLFEQFAAAHQSDGFTIQKESARGLALYYGGNSVSVFLRNLYVNTARDVVVAVTLWQGNVSVGRARFFDDPKERVRREVRPVFASQESIEWSDGGQTQTSEQVVEHVVTSLLEMAHR